MGGIAFGDRWQDGTSPGIGRASGGALFIDEFGVVWCATGWKPVLPGAWVLDRLWRLWAGRPLPWVVGGGLMGRIAFGDCGRDARHPGLEVG